MVCLERKGPSKIKQQDWEDVICYQHMANLNDLNTNDENWHHRWDEWECSSIQSIFYWKVTHQGLCDKEKAVKNMEVGGMNKSSKILHLLDFFLMKDSSGVESSTQSYAPVLQRLPSPFRLNKVLLTRANWGLCSLPLPLSTHLSKLLKTDIAPALES